MKLIYLFNILQIFLEEEKTEKLGTLFKGRVWAVGLAPKFFSVQISIWFDHCLGVGEGVGRMVHGEIIASRKIV